VTITDRLGIAHTVDLDSVEFILQKKAIMTYPYRKLKETDLRQGQVAIDSISRGDPLPLQEGIFDEDAGSTELRFYCRPSW